MHSPSDIHSNLGDALFGRTRQQVLRLFYGQPHRSFFLREVVRRADVGVGAVQRELKRLTEAGLLTVSRQGNQFHYQANPRCPIYAEMHAIVVKTFGVVDLLREALLPLGDNIRAAFVYGSIADGTERAESDIDLMVVGDVGFESLVGALHPYQEGLGREVNPNLFTPNEFERKMNERNSFVAQVMEKPKLMVLGTDSDVRESG